MRCDWPRNLLLERNGTRHRVDSFVVHNHCTEGRTALDVKAYQHGDKLVHHLSGTAAGKRVQFVLPDGHNSEKIVVNITDAEGNFAPPAPEITPTRAAADPLGLKATAVVDQVSALIKGVDATVETSPVVHNFANGTDVPVDVLATVCFAKGGHLRIGMVCERDEWGPTEERSGHRREIAEGAELRRMLIVSKDRFVGSLLHH